MQKNIYEEYRRILLKASRNVNEQADKKKNLSSNMISYGEVSVASRILKDFGHKVRCLADFDNEFLRIKELKIDDIAINLGAKEHHLTQQERTFCEVIGHGYIARDQDGIVRWHDMQPIKFEKEWIKGMDTCRLYGDIFDFVKWEDTEPWSVEELLAEEA